MARLAGYQTLLKDVLRYTARLGEDTGSLERAIAMLANIQVKVKHALVLHHLDGMPGDVSSFGGLVRHVSSFC